MTPVPALPLAGIGILWAAADAARITHRASRLPSNAFRSVIRHEHRPTLDRGDELCKGLGISIALATMPLAETQQ